MQLTTYISFLIALYWIHYPTPLLAQIAASKIIKTETCWVHPIGMDTTSKAYIASVTNYNSNGRKEKVSTFNKEGILLYEFFFDYNNNNKSLEIYWFDADSTKIKSQSEVYSSNGALTQIVRYDNEGQQLDACHFDYNNQQKTKETYYNKDNIKVYTIDYSYSPAQNIIRETYTNFLSNEVFLGATDLNKQALPISYTQYKSSGPLEKSIEYQRDAQGRIISKKINIESNQLEINEVYKYANDSLECFIYLGSDKILTEHTLYTFEYY